MLELADGRALLWSETLRVLILTAFLTSNVICVESLTPLCLSFPSAKHNSIHLAGLLGRLNECKVLRAVCAHSNA